MDYKVFFIFVLLFFIFSLIQTSFLVHFSFLGVSPNLVLILVCLLAFFSSTKKESNKYVGIYLTVIAGFLLDIFSKSFFGISIIALLVVYFFIKYFKQLLKDAPRYYSIVYFAIFLVFSFAIHDFFIGLGSLLANHFFTPLESSIHQGGMFEFKTPSFLTGFTYPGICAFLIKIIYNLLFGIIGFYFFKTIPILKL